MSVASSRRILFLLLLKHLDNADLHLSYYGQIDPLQVKARPHAQIVLLTLSELLVIA